MKADIGKREERELALIVALAPRDIDELLRLADRAQRHGLQVNLHRMGADALTIGRHVFVAAGMCWRYVDGDLPGKRGERGAYVDAQALAQALREARTLSGINTHVRLSHGYGCVVVASDETTTRVDAVIDYNEQEWN